MDHLIFKKLSTIIYDKSGITLNDQKKSLLEGRISKRIRALNLNTAKEYYQYLIDNREDEIEHLIDVISTNVTHFYRESTHFEILHKYLVEWSNNNQQRFRIWSAASSSGEEPYTISMVATDALADRRADLKILATDISRPMLIKCREAIYTEKALINLPPKYRTNYTRAINNYKEEKLFSITDDVKNRVLFKRINLSTPPFPMKGPLDAIFIRNVMIYFDNSVKQRLINEAHRLLKVGGILFIGHSENLTDLNHKFKPLSPSAYQKISK
jgi:chemotaxis protein methyltransferase CheR